MDVLNSRLLLTHVSPAKNSPGLISALHLGSIPVCLWFGGRRFPIVLRWHDVRTTGAGSLQQWRENTSLSLSEDGCVYPLDPKLGFSYTEDDANEDILKRSSRADAGALVRLAAAHCSGVVIH